MPGQIDLVDYLKTRYRATTGQCIRFINDGNVTVGANKATDRYISAEHRGNILLTNLDKLKPVVAPLQTKKWKSKREGKEII